MWFKAFTDHDYYQLTFVLPAIFLSVTIMEYYVRNIQPKLNTRVANIVLAGLWLAIAVSVYHNRNIQKARYSKPEYVYINPALYEIEPYLLEIGIMPQDHVVSVPDPSPNMSLNAINRYGYTEEFNSKNYNINTFKKDGAAYLLISDSNYLGNPLYIPYEKKRIGKYKGISVFDIR